MLWSDRWFIYSQLSAEAMIQICEWREIISIRSFTCLQPGTRKLHTASPPETLTVTVATQHLGPADGSSWPTWVGHHIWFELLPWIMGPNVAHIRKSHGAARSEIDSYSVQDDLITRQFFSYEGSTNNIPQTPPQPQTPPLCLLKTPSTRHYTHTLPLNLSVQISVSAVRFDVTTDTLIEFLCALIWNSWEIWFYLVYVVFRQIDRMLKTTDRTNDRINK